ncbi:MAG: hypothetical protein ACI9H6_000300 [Patiriisocius sp.]|jgi:hypothetical protein
MKTHFTKYFLVYAVVPLLLFVVTASYYRFIVINDYVVSYEGDCDPTAESCFIGCEDDECTEEYFYSVVERHASEIKEICGVDITDCDDSYECPAEGTKCFISYCDDSEDECSNITDF